MAVVQTEKYGTLCILPLPPQSRVREILEWFTNIDVSYSGKEVRTKYRSLPRLTLIQDIPETTRNDVRAFWNYYNNITKRWVVPFWHQAKKVGALEVGDGSLALQTGDILEGALLLIYQSPDKWEVKEVVDNVAGTIQFTPPMSADFSHATVMFAEVGVMDSDPATVTNGMDAITSVSYELLNGVKIPETTYPQYNGQDYITHQMDRPGAQTTYTIETRADRSDFTVGRFEVRYPWYQNTISSTQKFVSDNLQDTHNFRMWLSRRSGKFLPYWESRHKVDLQLVQNGIVSDTLYVPQINEINSGTSLKKTHIAIHKVDGEVLLRNIVSWLFNGDNYELTLNAPVNIDVSNISYVSLLSNNRLASDKFEIVFGNGQHAECTFQVVEIEQ